MVDLSLLMHDVFFLYKIEFFKIIYKKFVNYFIIFERFMNISETNYLFSSISNNKPYVNSDDLFYIGTGLGLAGGLLCACVIVYFKYKKKSMELALLPLEVAI